MKHFFTYIFYILTVSSAFGQTAASFIPKTNNIPTSPEVAMLGRFGDIPVSYYTGTPNISIPLYTIKASGIEIPIILSYQSSGIKVSDEATWVGLGWNLVPEGTIVQEVRGIKDTYDVNLYSSSTPTAYEAFKARFAAQPENNFRLIKQKGLYLYNFCGNPGGVPNIINEDSPPIINSLLEGNGQPDLYHYNFSGFSGSFYINPDNDQIVFLNKNMNITIIKQGGFQAITPDGNKFNFGIIETAYSMDPNDKYAGETHKVSSIELVGGKNIYFNYTDAHLSSKIYSQNAVMNFGCTNPPPSYLPVTYSTTNSDIKILSSIITDDIEIKFNTGTRSDINVYYNDTGKKLESIDIKSVISNKKIKSFIFNYNYFTSYPLTGIDTNDKRLKLESIKEVGYNETGITDNTKPPYILTYNTSINMPPKNSFAKDFWGYNNGYTINTGLLADLDYFNYPYKPEYIDLYHPAPFVYNYNKNYRYSDNTKANALMLNKITYPTGGYTIFEFEPHSFSNQYIPDRAKLLPASKVITRLANQVDTEVSQTFNLTAAGILKFTNTFTHGFPTVAGGGADTGTIGVIYNNAKIIVEKTKNGVTTIIKTWLPSNIMTLSVFTTSGTIAWTEELYIPYDAGATYKLKAVFPNVSYTYPNLYVAKTNAQMNYFDETGIDTSVSNQGGFRIKSIKNYTSNNIIASYKQIKYLNENGTSSGKLLNKFHPLSALDGFCNNCNSIGDSYSFKQVQLSGDDFGTSGGTVIGYSRVEEIDIDSLNTTIGKKVFQYYNTENNTKNGFPTFVNPYNGLLQKDQIFNNATTKLIEKNYQYVNTIPESPFEGIKITNRSFGTVDYGDGIPIEDIIAENPQYPNEYDPYKYSYEAYVMKSYWLQSLATTTSEYLGGTQITSTQNNTYSTNAQLRTITNTFATGEESSEKYYYPGEISGAPASEAQMVINKMTGIPVVTEQYNGVQLISRQNSEYISDVTTANHMMPKYIYHKKGDISSTASEKRITFDKYDDRGNLLQYTLENGTPVCYIWGYNRSIPIAMIQNATYLSFSSTVNNLITSAQNFSNSNNESSLLTALNSIRVYLPDAMVTTYTFRPGVGVNTITDPKGDKITYTYDNFGRLIFVKDKYGNVLSENQYNYRP